MIRGSFGHQPNSRSALNLSSQEFVGGNGGNEIYGIFQQQQQQQQQRNMTNPGYGESNLFSTAPNQNPGSSAPPHDFRYQYMEFYYQKGPNVAPINSISPAESTHSIRSDQ
jgi:hypothetical protein